jgi:hypothetical protein
MFFFHDQDAVVKSPMHADEYVVVANTSSTCRWFLPISKCMPMLYTPGFKQNAETCRLHFDFVMK